MKKNIFCTAVLLLLLTALHAQVLIQFEPAINGQTLDGLSYVRLINAGTTPVEGVLKINVKDAQGRTAVLIQTPMFRLMPGNNTTDRTAYSRSAVRFGSTVAGNALSQTSRFPEGEYEYCYEFSTDPKSTTPQTYFNCFQHVLQPMTPLLLADPFNKSTICSTRPDLIWTPPMPLHPEMRFRVLLTEIKERQNAAEALSMNLPIVLTGNLTTNLLNFPPQAPSLQEGKTYAWQVVAYTGKTAVTQSEIWSFTVSCNERKVDSISPSYAELLDAPNGNFYLADKIVRFSFNNPYGGGKLDYEIKDLSNPSKEIKKLPSVAMQPGLNMISLDLSRHGGLKNGGQYVLTVKNIGNHPLQMRFLFKK